MTFTPLDIHAPRPLNAKEEAEVRRREDEARAQAAVHTPEQAALLIGFANLDDLAERIPERLRPHLDAVLTRPGFVHRVTAMWRSPEGPASLDQKAGRVTQLAESIDRAAVNRARQTASWEQDHLDVVTGKVDPTTTKRPLYFLDRDAMPRISDETEAALHVAYAERIRPEVLNAARAWLTEQLGPVAEPETKPTRRKR